MICSRRLVQNTPMESKAFNELGHNSCKQVFKCYAPSNVGMITWSVIVFNCNIIRKTCSLPIRQVSFRISISVSHPFTFALSSKIKRGKGVFVSLDVVRVVNQFPGRNSKFKVIEISCESVASCNPLLHGSTSLTFFICWNNFQDLSTIIEMRMSNKCIANSSSRWFQDF